MMSWKTENLVKVGGDGKNDQKRYCGVLKTLENKAADFIKQWKNKGLWKIAMK